MKIETKYSIGERVRLQREGLKQDIEGEIKQMRVFVSGSRITVTYTVEYTTIHGEPRYEEITDTRL